jgi:hypothetical protein
MMTVTTVVKGDITLGTAQRRKQMNEGTLSRKLSAQRSQQQPKQPRRPSGTSSANTVARKDILRRSVGQRRRNSKKNDGE